MLHLQQFACRLHGHMVCMKPMPLRRSKPACNAVRMASLCQVIILDEADSMTQAAQQAGAMFSMHAGGQISTQKENCMPT